MGALLAVRLARKIRASLQMELEAVRYFTNSTAVLGMILRESATYQEFVGMRVSKIQTKSDPETEWFWIPGELNIADMGMRPTVLPGDMGPGHTLPGGTFVDEGVSRGVADQEDTHAAAARGVQEGHAGHGQGCKGAIWTVVPTFRAKLGRVYSYVYTFLAGARKLANFTPITARTRGRARRP